jgi:hypothetical protein
MYLFYIYGSEFHLELYLSGPAFLNRVRLTAVLVENFVFFCGEYQDIPQIIDNAQNSNRTQELVLLYVIFASGSLQNFPIWTK